MSEGEGVQKVTMGAWTPPGCHGLCAVDLYIKNGEVINKGFPFKNKFYRREERASPASLTNPYVFLNLCNYI